MSLQRGQQTVQSREYWDIPFTPHGSLSEEEAAEELILRLRNAVDSHLMSEVPLGAFLSGGVDSSAVVAMMGADERTGQYLFNRFFRSRF